MPRTPVSDLRLNVTIRKHLFLLREKNLSTTRMGKSMLHVVLADRSGSIPGVFFDVPTHMANSLEVGKGVEVAGRVGEYKGQLQVNVERIVPAELANLEDFLPMARSALPAMEREFDELLASVGEPQLSNLLKAIFDDERTYHAFARAPAAKFNHHACVGGLLEHTLAVVRIVLAACDLYPDLHRDLAVVVALLHDVGKIHAYDPISFDMTAAGSLWTHLYMSASIVERAIESLPEFDPDLRLRVVHGILAHHGKLENGSPVLPMTLEAIVVHHADDLDSGVRGAVDHLERTLENGGLFTEPSHMHQARLYRGPRSTRSGQQTLW